MTSPKTPTSMSVSDKLIVTCGNCYNERAIDPFRLGVELKAFYNEHKTRIGRIGCKYDDLCIRYEVFSAQTVANKETAALERLRLAIRGEDPDQYHPNDLIALGEVEECIDDTIEALAPKEKS